MNEPCNCMMQAALIPSRCCFMRGRGPRAVQWCRVIGHQRRRRSGRLRRSSRRSWRSTACVAGLDRVAWGNMRCSAGCSASLTASHANIDLHKTNRHTCSLPCTLQKEDAAAVEAATRLYGDGPAVVEVRNGFAAIFTMPAAPGSRAVFTVGSGVTHSACRTRPLTLPTLACPVAGSDNRRPHGAGARHHPGGSGS